MLGAPQFLPGRTVGPDYQAPSAEGLGEIGLVEALIEEKSAKKRSGPPTGPLDRDPNVPGSKGLVPPERRRDWRAVLKGLDV